MGVPGPAIPSQNCFNVHFLGKEDAFTRAAQALLKPFKVPVQDFEPGQNEILEEDFWKTTVAVVHMEGLLPQREAVDPWMQAHAGGEHVWIALSLSGDDRIPAKWITAPDLWVVEADGKVSLEVIAQEWIARGAGAVVVFQPAIRSAFWISRNAAFGNSRGSLTPEKSPPVPETELFPTGIFTAGLVQALVEELLGENLFHKTTFSVERACLEVCPLHLARAAESGFASHAVFGEMFTERTAMTLLLKKGEFLGQVRARLRAWRGPEPKAWGARGR